ncbi:hypothetical protein [Ruegeria jejuensis]|uniref:hypothetical protein n=1 Tax=Ruegeria jejuensis TaxID=3233338 RepID=UPI00355BD889
MLHVLAAKIREVSHGLSLQTIAAAGAKVCLVLFVRASSAADLAVRVFDLAIAPKYVTGTSGVGFTQV